MKSRIIRMAVIFGIALTIGMPNISLGASDLPKALAIGTSSIGSTFYVIAVGMANLISKHTPMSATAEAVGGSDANMRAIKAGKVQLAMANSFSSTNAYHGTRQFAKDGRIPIRLISVGQPSLRQLVVRSDSGIRTPSELKGKKLIAKRRALAELELVADAILKAYGVDKRDVKYIATAKTKEAIDALITGTVDAAIIPGGIPAATLMKLFERIDARLIGISSQKTELILKELGPSFHTETIPPGTYRGQDTAVTVPSLSAGLVVAEGLSEQTVYEIAKTLFTHNEDLKMVHKAARHWTVQNTLKKFYIPLHAGAKKYFKEIGAWKPEYEKRQQALIAGSRSR